MSRALALVTSIAILFVVVGCGRDEQAVHTRYRAGVDVVGGDDPEGRGGEGAKQPAQGAPQAVAKPEAQAAGDKVPRKIKYTAEIRLVTEQFREAEEAIRKSIEDHGGFISLADVFTSPGTPRHGTWKARVPIAKFESFRRAIEKAAEVERSSVQTEDVTGEFYDLENHIKNKKAEEEALRELLRKTTDKMENMLAVQRELSTLRDGIERSEGRLRLLANLTDLTTATIHLQERAKYDPDRATATREDPSFSERSGKTFRNSWQSLLAFLQAVSLVTVALTPWLPFIIVGVGIVVYLSRRHRLAKATAPIVAPTEPPTLPTA
jgi:hypothetical protein